MMISRDVRIDWSQSSYALPSRIGIGDFDEAGRFAFECGFELATIIERLDGPHRISLIVRSVNAVRIMEAVRRVGRVATLTLLSDDASRMTLVVPADE
jgi:hypothetical protein